eukprot:9249794-Pyramimonas_sp.AAC.1
MACWACSFQLGGQVLQRDGHVAHASSFGARCWSSFEDGPSHWTPDICRSFRSSTILLTVLHVHLVDMAEVLLRERDEVGVEAVEAPLSLVSIFRSSEISILPDHV